MFGLSDENVLTHVECQERAPEYDEAEAVTLYYNQTDPTVISDGVDRVSVVDRGDDRYLVDYWGYMIGYLEVTRAGVAELGEHLLGDRRPVPRWILDASTSTDLPWWVPEEYDGTPTRSCDRCWSETATDEILTPGTMDGEPDEAFCTDCWDEIRDEWQPGYALERQSRLERADELYHEAQTSPETIDVAELYELTQRTDETVRWHALRALNAVAKTRPEDVVDFVPAFEPFLESPNAEVREAALRWFATVADEYLSQVTPVAMTIVDNLEVGADENVLEAAITYVSRVSAGDPAAVVDAAPKIGALLQENPPVEGRAVLALARIAKEYPESILPVTDALLEYVETADGSTGPSALAALGHVSKEYPNVGESAIPTLLDLLDADSFYIRANSAGLLADLSDEYPGELKEAIPRVVSLLDDEDEKARYNGTSILAKVAKAYPEAVKPAVGGLIDALNDEFEYTRSNACWALGYIKAEEATSELELLADSDSSEEVQNAAQYALQQLE